MSNTYEPNYRTIKEIYFKYIIFEKEAGESNVTIFGYYANPFVNSLVPVDYGCEFSMLIDLLVAAKDSGDPIIEAIAEKLNEKQEECPVMIPVEQILNKPLRINNVVLRIYKPHEKDETGRWKEMEDNFYIIDHVELKPYVTEYNVLAEKQSNATFSTCFTLLEMSYTYYLQLLKFSTPVKKARKKAGLKNKLLFKLAEIHHKNLNNE